ncbi:hypothetical protein Acsp03_44020 [Actinomadura sp. NBRC 104412]|uniref:hypothetical protein n=1 Tax=Actinomadura sp. NBRC 104412 TaxID=3032203 RepID=UPI0024A50D55|nr:hypothetical protein [Actinomadura sp. NBRC 104412]GLZ06936.1 hypothetical protein Acsp03_44020 [Actinomadura sp. NBRC 104412]
MTVGTTRFVAVLSSPRRPSADPSSGGPPSPPGIDPEEFRLALLEDTYEVAAGLDLVTPALVLDPPDQPDAEAITWPGTPIVRERGLAAAFAALGALGAEEAVLLAGDAPDLPPLLIGKLFRALGSAPASACQARGPGGPDGLVALAARLPLPPWLDAALADVDLDTPDALARLRAAAPRPGQVPQGPAWHRLRTRADLGVLDPGLEGWENTRALLEGHPLSS